MTAEGRRVDALDRIWWRPNPGVAERLLLTPLVAAEGMFRATAALRDLLYDTGLIAAFRPPVPVISVGNLAVGGAGKTPVVLAIGERLLAAGRHPAVLSRGYGAEDGGVRVVSDGKETLLAASQGGDEPVMLARRLPGLRVLCGPNRAALARLAVEGLRADVLVLDDGFQHRRLRRDLDVVVLDASNPWGNGHCLPRGPNREPVGALARAHLLWLTHADRATGDRLEKLRAAARHYTGSEPIESLHAPSEVLDASLEHRFGLGSLAGRKVGLLTGVARPESVRRTVESLGASVVLSRDYADHHRFTKEELDEALEASTKAGATELVTTEKDVVRLPPELATDPRLKVLRIAVEVLRGSEYLDAAVAKALEAGDALRRQGWED